ncbi:MAG: sirohydrochlorin cobaltochelatase [Desulfovibrionaceae bacterium]
MKRLFLMILVCCLLLPPSTSAAGEKKATLLVAFGTTVESAMPSLNALHAAYTAQGDPVLWAYTSDIIRRKLAKQGKPVLSVHAALNKAAAMGITELTVQSLHVAPAEEFSQLERMIVKNLTQHPGRFKKVLLGSPLLVSSQDLQEVMTSVLASLPKERKAHEALVLMGHGNNRGSGDLILAATATAFHEKDPLVWLATVEGALSFDHVLPQLKAAGVKKVWLQPFMIVAGDHANNDLAGPEDDSWASRIKAAGMTPVPHLKGLGELQGIQKIFLRHSSASTDDMANSKKSDE